MKRQNSYFDSEALSQSFLKSILGESFSKREPDRRKLLAGSLTDMILTSPDEIEDNFIFSNSITLPSESLLLIIDNSIEDAFANSIEPDFNNSDFCNILHLHRDFYNYDSRLKENTFIDRVKKYEDYINLSYSSYTEDKVLLPQEFYDECYSYATSFLTEEATKDHFDVKENEEILFQQPLFATIKGEACKGLPDFIKINHKERYIHLYDIKVTEANSRNEYRNIIKRYRYDFQLAFYYDLLSEIYPDYNIDYPIILTVSKNNINKPFAFHLTDSDLETGRFGCSITKGTIIYNNSSRTVNRNSVVYGYLDAIEKYKQIKKLKIEDSDIDYAYNKGNFKLNLFET